MRHLVDGYLGHTISRRSFMHSLAAIGVSTPGIAATVRSAAAVTDGSSGSGSEITGTGGEPADRELPTKPAFHESAPLEREDC